MSREFRYKTTFVTTAKVIATEDEDRFISKASLRGLKGLVPEGLDIEGNPDLLFIAANSACVGLCNKNYDAITPETAIAINDSARHKPINIQHDRDSIAGVVIESGFTKYGSNEPITAEQASELKEPFNMAFVGALWKTVEPRIAKYISNVGDSIGEQAMSISWEVGFDSYSIATKSKNLFDAKIIKASDGDFESYDKMLTANGGEGKDDSGNIVYRVLDGNALILGFGIVTNPAGNVRGILPLDKSDQSKASVPSNTLSSAHQEYLASQPESGPGYHMCNIMMKDGTKHMGIPVLNHSILPDHIKADDIDTMEACNITPKRNPAEANEKNVEDIRLTSNNASVNLNTTITAMEIKSLSDLKTHWEEFRKLESSASIPAIDTLTKTIEDKSKEYVDKLNEAEAAAEKLRTSQAETEKRAKDLEASLAQVRQELDQVKADAAAAAALTQFNERMGSFDEKFDLDDEDRKLIAEEVRDVANDEAFTKVFAKYEKLLAAKMKKAKKDGEKKGDKMHDMEDDDDEDDAEAKKIKAAIASVTEDKSGAVVPNNAIPPENDDLGSKMKAAFGEALSINEKSVNELSQKKS